MTTYPGGKGGAGVYQTLINQMPPHATYIEAFAGGGAVLRHKRPAALNVAIDRCGGALERLGDVWRGAGGVTVGNIVGNDGAAGGGDVSSSSAAGVASIDGDGGGSGVLSGGGGTQAAQRVATLAGNDGALRSASSPAPAAMTVRPGTRLDLVQGDCLPWLLARDWDGDEVVYADPPYLMGTRRSERDYYEFEYDDQDHADLLAVLRSLPCRVLISGYWSDLYADLLADWRAISFQTTDRGGNLRTEWAWMNYPQPARLHDYSFLGEDYRERERIKRKRDRWVRMINDMPTLERAAMIEEIGGLE